MVGVPRSSGCHLCVTRRVKCDQRQPGCAKCETYGKPCPGYEKGFKFIAGKPYRSKRRPAGDQTHKSPISSSTSFSGSDSGSSDQLAIRQAIAPEVSSVDMNVLQSLTVMIDDFTSPVRPDQAHAPSGWLGFLPSIYGGSSTLDAAIRSFVAHHFGKTFQNDQMIKYARSSYGEALHRLRRALLNSDEVLSSNIFCTVVILCFYELFTDVEDPDSWMKHAKGLGQLIQMRGPYRYRTDLEISLLRTARGLIVMQSMFGGEPCFLANDDWHKMMKQHYVPEIPFNYHESIENFFALFTQSPGLVHKLYGLREKDPSSPEVLLEISNAITQALDIESKLDMWYDNWAQISSPPAECLSARDDLLYPIILTYTDITDAAIYCGYYAFRIIVHETLRTFGSPGAHGDKVLFFRDQICRSIEHAGVGFLGPYRIAFPVRVAIEVSDPITISWLHARLQEFFKVYAAANPENFKPII